MNSERIFYFLTVFIAFLTGASVMTCIMRDPKPRLHTVSRPPVWPVIVIRGDPTDEDMKRMEEMRQRLQDAADVRNGRVYDSEAQ